LLELDYAYGNDDSSGDGGGALLANYGLRVSGRNWGLDAVFMRPLVPAIDLELLPLGIPGIAFTYRTDGSAVAPARPPVPR